MIRPIHLRGPVLALGLAAWALAAVPADTDTADDGATGDMADTDAAPPPLRYTLLRLNVRPADATVFLDSQCLGERVWMVSLAPGPHSLDLRRDGFRACARSFEARPGKPLELDIDMPPGAGAPAP